MYKVYLLLGSNMGDRKGLLDAALVELIERLLPDYLEVGSLDDAVNSSEVMETEPWGFECADKFLNQSFCCLTNLSPKEVLDVCLDVEKGLGRVRTEPDYDSAGNRIYHSRPIDIDILAIEEQVNGKWESLTINLPELVVPHPQIKTRKFAEVLFKKVWGKRPF